VSAKGAPHDGPGKTQQRHCERSFGTNVLVLGKRRDNLLLLSEPLKSDVNKNDVMMMMIAFITFKSSLVPLLEGL